MNKKSWMYTDKEANYWCMRIIKAKDFKHLNEIIRNKDFLKFRKSRKIKCLESF